MEGLKLYFAELYPYVDMLWEKPQFNSSCVPMYYWVEYGPVDGDLFGIDITPIAGGVSFTNIGKDICKSPENYIFKVDIAYENGDISPAISKTVLVGKEFRKC